MTVMKAPPADPLGRIIWRPSRAPEQIWRVQTGFRNGHAKYRKSGTGAPNFKFRFEPNPTWLTYRWIGFLR